MADRNHASFTFFHDPALLHFIGRARAMLNRIAGKNREYPPEPLLWRSRRCPPAQDPAKAAFQTAKAATFRRGPRRRCAVGFDRARSVGGRDRDGDGGQQLVDQARQIGRVAVQPDFQQRQGDGLDVVGDDEVAVLQAGPGLGQAEPEQQAPRADPERDVRVLVNRLAQGRQVIAHRPAGCRFAHLLLQGQQLLVSDDRRRLGLDAVALADRRFKNLDDLFALRIPIRSFMTNRSSRASGSG